MSQVLLKKAHSNVNMVLVFLLVGIVLVEYKMEGQIGKERKKRKEVKMRDIDDKRDFSCKSTLLLLTGELEEPITAIKHGRKAGITATTC